MYLLTFKEGENEPKNFYYFNNNNAIKMQRQMILKELNNLIAHKIYLIQI